MSEQDGPDLLGEWRRLVDSLVGSAASVAGRSAVPRELLRVSQRQLELLQEVVDRERRLQGELAAMVTAPVGVVFDLLEEAGETLRLQAEALESAGRALEDTAGLMKRQAERFERSVSALRQPAALARTAAGAARPSRKTSSGEKPSGRTKTAAGKKRPAGAKPAASRKGPAGTKGSTGAKARRK